MSSRSSQFLFVFGIFNVLYRPSSFALPELFLDSIAAFKLANCIRPLVSFDPVWFAKDLLEIIKHDIENYKPSDSFQPNYLVDDPDAWKNVSQLIASKGYPVEDYVVTTEDGYILSVQRIPHGRDGDSKKPKKAVLIMHGFLLSAADFVFNLPNQSLGFVLADAGFDVWLGNARGNTYSKKHGNRSIESKEFWEFSFEEIGMYDVSAMIDHMLKVTGNEKVSYIGYSVGANMVLSLLSEKPSYNNQVDIAILLAPTAICYYTRSQLKNFAPFAPCLKSFYDAVGIYEFVPSSDSMKFISQHFCRGASEDALCNSVLFMITGSNMYQQNKTRLNVYLSHTPAGTSTKHLDHVSQLCSKPKFRKYDYGARRNVRQYGQPDPPEYWLHNITTPFYLFSSKEDLLADEGDVDYLQANLPGATRIVVESPFSHLDFAWGINATSYVYQQVMDLLNKPNF